MVDFHKWSQWMKLSESRVPQEPFTHTYIRDIKERYEIKKDDDLEELINLVASNIGSLTNPTKLENCFKSVKQSCLSKDTIKNYIDLMQDALSSRNPSDLTSKARNTLTHHQNITSQT